MYLIYSEDSTILIFPLKQNNLKEKIDESNNLYKFLDEIQKVSSLLLYYL